MNAGNWKLVLDEIEVVNLNYFTATSCHELVSVLNLVLDTISSPQFIVTCCKLLLNTDTDMLGHRLFLKNGQSGSDHLSH